MDYIGVSAPGAAAEPPQTVLEDARAVGSGLAAAGAVVLCGGLDGAMAALAEGVRDGGGICVGLLPGSDRGAGAEPLTVAIATGIGQARNSVLVTASDALVAIGRGFGTLSEIALALRLGRDVVTLDSWPLDQKPSRMHEASSAAQAVELALRLARAR